MQPQAFIDFVEDQGLGDGALELAAGPGEVVIEGFKVPPPRRSGAGTAILTALCRAASAAGIVLAVRPVPVTILVADPIPPRALEAFYARHGFAPEPDGVWRRSPSAAP